MRRETCTGEKAATRPEKIEAVSSLLHRRFFQRSTLDDPHSKAQMKPTVQIKEGKGLSPLEGLQEESKPPLPPNSTYNLTVRL
mmetsp:Transcript_31932/g.66773  ORF Transcript_31932/g.66773 Transcript_31932/m.66773 type:complete len:83 (-) Transcript_31932:156-404(-)